MAYFTQTADISRAGRNFVKPFISAFGTGRSFSAKVFRVEAAGADVEIAASGGANPASVFEEGAGVYSLTVPDAAMSTPNNYYAILSDNVTGEAIRIPMWSHLTVDFDDFVQLRVGDAASALNGLHGFNNTTNKATVALALKKALEYDAGLKLEVGDVSAETFNGITAPEDVAKALAAIYNKDVAIKGLLDDGDYGLSALKQLIEAKHDLVMDELVGDIGAAGVGSATDLATALKAIYDQAADQAITVEGIADGVWDEMISGHTTAGSFGKYLQDLSTNVDDIEGLIGTAGAGQQQTVFEELAAMEGRLDTAVSDAQGAIEDKADAVQLALENHVDAAEGVITGAISTSEGVITGAISTSEGVVTGAISTSEGVVTGAISTSEGVITGAITDTETLLDGHLDTIEGKVDDVKGDTADLLAAVGTWGAETLVQRLAAIKAVVDTMTAVGQAARLSLYCPERISGFRTANLAVQVALVSRNELGADDDLAMVGNGRAFLRVLGQGGSPLSGRLYTDMAMSTAATAGSDAAYTGYSVMTANGGSNAKFNLYFKVEPKDNEAFTFEATGQDTDGSGGSVISKVTTVKQMVVASTFAVAVGGAF